MLKFALLKFVCALACCLSPLVMAQAAEPVVVALLQEEVGKVPTLKATDVEEQKKLVDKTVKVTGKVSKIYKPESGNVVVLNFGRDIKTCFKVAINKRDYGNWEGGVPAIEKMYGDKTLTVTGKMILYKDAPEIVVSKPGEIEVAAE
ncbi:hypothetical protein NA78x_000126 [Anatilimnocola sp. NA78]|uniref:hypothetical protein n=1 Tax=Anatilimnocola sp. NA78 TaxID=3415683 RepID=UPI003CE55EF3